MEAPFLRCFLFFGSNRPQNTRRPQVLASKWCAVQRFSTKQLELLSSCELRHKRDVCLCHAWNRLTWPWWPRLAAKDHSFNPTELPKARNWLRSISTVLPIRFWNRKSYWLPTQTKATPQSRPAVDTPPRHLDHLELGHHR